MSLQFRDGADIAGVQFGDGMSVLPMGTLMCARRSSALRADVLQVGVVLDDAG